MHIHPPKPLHGWREFIGEVGIIVLGILIALALEQIVEVVHWRDKVAEATETLRDPVGNLAILAAEQQVAAPCIDRQLADLQARLLAPGAFRPAPSFTDATGSNVVRRPTRLWSDGAWRAVVAEGIATHMPAELRERMDRIVGSADQARDLSHQADTLGWRLNTLAFPIQDAGARARLAEEVAELRGRMGLMTLVSGQMLGSVRALAMLPPGADARRWLLGGGSGTITFCRQHHLPLGKIAAT